MNFYLINLVKSCNTLHELKRELEKPLGWFRFKSKKKAKELEKQLDTAISDIVYKDIWDIQYLYDLERMFFVFYKDLKDYMLDITIPSYDPNNYNPKNFYPIYFYDEKNVSEKLLLVASQIALQLSHLQTGEVSYTKKKNVRRGKFLGQAILKNYSTIKINNVLPLAQELIDKAKRD